MISANAHAEVELQRKTFKPTSLQIARQRQ